VHLRVRQECGRVGCCGQSQAMAPAEHFFSTAHPLIRPYEPGETRYRCYVDETVFELE
jgi:hypothetical protein